MSNHILTFIQCVLIGVNMPALDEIEDVELLLQRVHVGEIERLLHRLE